MSKKSEAMQPIDGQEHQPEVEGDAGQGSEVYPLPPVRLLRRPVEQGWHEGHEEDEGVDAEDDDEDIAVLLDIITESTWASLGDGGSNDGHFDAVGCLLSSS